MRIPVRSATRIMVRRAPETVYHGHMRQDVELARLLEAHKGELKSIADAAADGNRTKAVDATSSLAIALATGNPALGALAPLGRKAIARAFGNSVNAVLTRELAALAKDEERRAFLNQIGEVVEVLLGQTLIQIIQSQHAVSEELLETFGGLRRDLDAFRNDLAAEIASTPEAAHIELAEVAEGAIGVRVAATTSKRVVLKHMVVKGAGSIGIDLT